MCNLAILYVEDEEADVIMLQYACKKAGIRHRLLAVDNGEEALSYLSGTGKYADRTEHPVPGLILLDLNIPRISGLKVLQWIREQPQFADVPVVVYTSAAQPAEMEKARGLGANDYVVKPSGVEETKSAIQKIVARWSPDP